MNKELTWIAEARKHIGLLENTSKTQHHPHIIRWLEQMGSFNGEAKAWWRDDEQPWCGLYVGVCLGISGRFVVREWYRAREWESIQMNKLANPAYGCLVTFTRNGGGHVGFVVGVDQKNNLMVLGGKHHIPGPCPLEKAGPLRRIKMFGPEHRGKVLVPEACTIHLIVVLAEKLTGRVVRVHHAPPVPFGILGINADVGIGRGPGRHGIDTPVDENAELDIGKPFREGTAVDRFPCRLIGLCGSTHNQE